MRQLQSDGAPRPMGPYSQAVETGGTIFVSGQIPVDPVTGDICRKDIKAQTEMVIDHAENILQAAGLGLEHVVKAEIFLTDPGDLALMNEVYSSRFSGKIRPARSVVGVSFLPKGAMIEFACVARSD
ncbi:MAG: hypothetical protein GF408_01320 [Candidatus Omnitrophica bacterium]|nr:hypothetical protein [Candidatus Omnitrophota bacterium]